VPLPSLLVVRCRVRSLSGVGDKISRVSHIFAWNWHEAKLPEVENGLNPTTNFQGSDKQAGV
jgi:hypothetical protein